jgi:hypothetical protein
MKKNDEMNSEIQTTLLTDISVLNVKEIHGLMAVNIA